MARCKYPDSVCANMTLLHGMAYCDSVPCSLRDELPKPTNADRIRAMSDEELADQLVISLDGLAPCKMWAAPATGKIYLSGATAARDMLTWLQQPTPEEGERNV